MRVGARPHHAGTGPVEPGTGWAEARERFGEKADPDVLRVPLLINICTSPGTDLVEQPARHLRVVEERRVQVAVGAIIRAQLGAESSPARKRNVRRDRLGQADRVVDTPCATYSTSRQPGTP